MFSKKFGHFDVTLPIALEKLPESFKTTVIEKLAPEAHLGRAYTAPLEMKESYDNARTMLSSSSGSMR